MRTTLRMVGKQRIETARKPTNLYLDSQIKDDATKLAGERYGSSLSVLIERLLVREMSLKRGVLAVSGKKRGQAA